MSDAIKVILFVALILVLIAFGPLLTIWALNTLFPVLAIPYSLDTWFAVIVVGGLFKTSIKTK